VAEITFFTLFYILLIRCLTEILATKTGEIHMSSIETDKQIALRAFLGLLSELQSKGKITGAQFRGYRELWINQQPNDRDVLVWDLKQLLKKETKPELPKDQSIGTLKKPARQKL
jgi:hypothetical protein